MVRRLTTVCFRLTRNNLHCKIWQNDETACEIKLFNLFIYSARSVSSDVCVRSLSQSDSRVHESARGGASASRSGLRPLFPATIQR